ncbi:TNF receptor-associated factor 5-like [Halichondria panicea]|uniref:TNF receptor-associated factor 5-like n=1 Tax=Halichondria panicea TaxID=6063 RepID=UPI00312B85F2
MPEHLRENLLTHISLLATSHDKQQAEITQQRGEEITSLKAKVKTDLERMQQLLTTAPPPIVNSRPLGLPVLTMTEFQRYKRTNNRWFSPPVYIHHQGYKICLRVNANGFARCKGTHVSVWVLFMRGEFNDSLKWPFCGVISFQLLDQVNNDHKTGTNIYDDKTSNKNCTRVTEGERSEGRGNGMFIVHTELEPRYLQNDTLLFQIHKVELK